MDPLPGGFIGVCVGRSGEQSLGCYASIEEGGNFRLRLSYAPVTTGKKMAISP